MKRSFILICAFGAVMFSCQNQKKESQADMDNPFFTEWTTPYGVPPFDEIKIEHYLPAIKEGIKQREAEVETIVANTSEPTFENTILALDKSGELLNKVTGTFYPLNSANTSDEMQAVAREVSPLMTQHRDNVSMNPGLFKKIESVYNRRNELGLDKEQMRATEKYYDDFVRNGASLSAEDQTKLRELNEELSKLSLHFGENLLAETNRNFKLVVDKEEDLAGLPDDVIARAAEDAKSFGEDGKWAFTLAKPSMLPFLQYADNRDLREKLYRGYFMRGNNDNEFDNKEIIQKIVKLRDQRAKLLGFKNHAAYVIDVNMAKTPEAVYEFLMQLWDPAMEMAKHDLKEMQAIIDKEGGDFKLASWDWWYYIEKLRKQKFDLDEAELKPYFSLDNAKKGIFYVVEKLYGLKFEKRDWPTYNKEAEVYEVLEADGSKLGVLYMDFHPRDGKRVGAWSTQFRNATYRNGERVPTIGTIVMNFTRPAGDTPALLSFDEVSTFFHEFGHALHGLFADGPYDRTAGSVPRDFVELPSQIMENWAAEPEVMKVYATHYQTGEPIPDELIKKLEMSGTFNQGFQTGEFVAAALLDMDFHTTENPVIEDVRAFEKASMDHIGLIEEILPRYRSTYFAHIFSGGYSAGYYVYYWAGVLDSDAFYAFKETGDLFNPELAAKFRTLLEKCGADDGMTVYENFRGKAPSIDPFLMKKGLK
ncbi:peptidyl-dipeptidase Dcp Metallo peptidase. MEROPS family M03A [Mariniphaga anaerophila]|uniref:Peptidyl-dipeptidase Dcp Metallo peptidase. MEROPS family M03A n=1 Tax=Mariniphaga anaerophila TaxID=1484053 RepID=A0A1M4T6U1_9BACT|nr:M3 family metallopeptidase [Mariniphaga anaerophila]SHE40171.1 peptidyl-dipeptidase Dcp Metallo peptidase. MEROPS family M03A [Mariniphaga anaerophila]